MFDNRFLAGVVAGLPVSLLCLGYLLARRDHVLAVLTEGGGSGSLPPDVATVLLVGAGLAIGPGLGLAAAAVYGLAPSEQLYVGLALVLATLFTVGAIAARTPMAAEKIVLNYAVAGCLGLLMPRLLAA